jgi:hypothetical protein
MSLFQLTILIVLIFGFQAKAFEIDKVVKAIEAAQQAKTVKAELSPNKIQDINLKNGYARVVGEFDGYVDYFLFRCGKAKSKVCEKNQALVSIVQYDCGPECEQIITFFNISKSGKLEQLKVNGPLDPKELFGLSKSSILQNQLNEKCMDSQNRILTEEQKSGRRCPYFFSFSKSKSVLSVYEKSNSALSLSVESGLNLKNVFEFQFQNGQFHGSLTSGSFFLLDKATRAKLF